MGLFGLKLFIVVLAVTPLRNLTGISLFRFRRALGLLVFYYITLHLLVWLFLDVQIWSQILGDILKRPYITIGMAAFCAADPAGRDLEQLVGAQSWARCAGGSGTG